MQKLLNIKRAAKHWTAETSLVLYYSQNYAAGIRWPTTNPQIDLNLPKQNPFLNQANQKILPNFPTQKIPESNPKSPPWSVSGLLWRGGSKRHLLDPPTISCISLCYCGITTVSLETHKETYKPNKPTSQLLGVRIETLWVKL